ncbi:MAG: tetratricopeptide repeat protein [Phycisphaerae bacterium]
MKRAWEMLPVLLCLAVLSAVGAPAPADDANAPAPAPGSGDSGESIQEMIRRLEAASGGNPIPEVKPLPKPPQDTGREVLKPSEVLDKTATTRPAQEDANQVRIPIDVDPVKETKPAAARGVDLQTLPADTIGNPILLADALYLGGHWKAAASFYREVVDNKKKFEATDRAWALYQIANCQRRYDPSESKATYKRLVSEFASSPWVESGQVQQRLVTWKLSAKPEAMVKDNRRQAADERNAGKGEQR